MRRAVCIVLICIVGLLTAVGCASNSAGVEIAPESDIVAVTFDFQKQKGYASNQFAVWVENENGDVIRTLYATRFTAKGGFRDRPDAIPVWVERCDPAQMDDVDAITGATPKPGSLRFVWDLTDENGRRVPDGTYRFFVEGTLRWKNRVLFSGELLLDGNERTAQAAPQYFYVSSNEQPALTDEATEHGMISNVWAEYIPLV